MPALFVYGTLMFAPVWEAVTASPVPASQPAVLADYIRYRVINEKYPAVIHKSGARVQGLVYESLSAAQLEVLDAFEGPGYQRIKTPVKLTGGPRSGELIEVGMYLALKVAALDRQPWEPQAFVKQDMAEFLQTYCSETRKPI